MKKYFDFEITDDHFSYTRKAAAIEAAEARDGLYATCTNLKKEPEAFEGVAH